MNIWISKIGAALVALTALSACDSGPAKDLLSGITAGVPKSSGAPLTQALMMRGQLTLVPPNGYCVDPETQRESFALIARCDALGAKPSTSTAPTGIMMVSISRPLSKKVMVNANDMAAAAELASVADQTETDGIVIFRANGTPPGGGFSDRHWRGAARLGPFVMSVALYGPKDGRAVSTEGAGVVKQLIAQTKAKSNLE